MLTCKSCVYNQSNVGTQKELIRQCIRFPPKMFLIPNNQGIITHVSYAIISNELIACGEYFDGIEDGEEVTPLSGTH